jgi:PIN domain nuclease of toxin-antitoxin system
VRLLLDTHIWLWSLLEPSRLGRKTRAALVNPKSELWLSPISVWEAIMLAEKGRVELLPTPAQWVVNGLKAAPLLQATLTHEVALESRRLNLSHQDPADRFLVATAVVYDLQLVTSDEKLLNVKNIPVTANS